MSFFSNHKHPRPGPIQGSPLNGLCHRVAIEARRILDMCICKMQHDNNILEINERDLPAPVRFIESSSTQVTARISNLQVTRIQDRPTFCRVRCNVTTPMSIEFECAQGTLQRGTTQHMCSHDVVLFVPEQSIFPFDIVATSSTNVPVGTVDANGRIVATVCCTTIIKVITETDLLIPSYGFATPPPAIEFSEDACRGFFDLPLYPRGR